jgi:UDP-glucose:(heptosyl)LPS alpha-1,3-glucosyltransferase
MTQVYPVDVYRVGSGVYPHWSRIQHPNPAARFLHILIRPVYLANRVIESKILSHPRLKKVVVNSEMEKRNLLHYYRIPEQKVEVIYNGVDLEQFHPRVKAHREGVREALETTGDEFVVLFPSNNFKRKGLTVLIDALSRMNRKDVAIWVAGKGRQGFFKALAKKGQVEQQVRFLGKRTDMERLYGAADLMVLPTQYDSFSNVVLEALACGIPAITTRNNGAAEVIEPGLNGFVLHDHEDSDELAALMEKVRTERENWGGQARRRAEDFPLEKSVETYARLFAAL